MTSQDCVLITQTLIDDFCHVSGDHQWIHQNQEVAIAPGNLLISLIPRLIKSVFNIDKFSRCVTGGYQRIQFLQPVTTGQSVGLSVQLINVKTRLDKNYVRMCCELTREKKTVVKATVIDVYFA